MGMQFRVLLNTDQYEYDKSEKCWKDRIRSDEYMAEKVEDGLPVHISGIVRKKSGSVTGALRAGTICYTKDLVDYLLDGNAESEIVKQQLENEKVDVFTGFEFEEHDEVTIDDVYDYIDNMSEQEFAQLQAMFSRFYGSSFSGKDVVEALNAMSDEELVAAVAPSMLEDITLEDAKKFAQSKEGQGALMMMLASCRN
jgi:hypothetical protein